MTDRPMQRRLASILVLAPCIACWSPAPAQAVDPLDRQLLTEPALRESEAILRRDLSGHYDVTQLAVLRIERVQLGHDYPLVKVLARFSARRNATRSPNFNERMYEPGSPMCRDWLYLHCGVPVGHVFEGKLEMVLAMDRSGSWFALAPRWRSRSRYSLDGYLVLDGRKQEGYVLFPK